MPKGTYLKTNSAIEINKPILFNMNMRDISIIIPTLNEAQNISRLLTYLLQFSMDVVKEIIVVDGGSTDGTIEIVKRNGAVACCAKIRGRGAQLAEAARLASGEILYFVHADTIPPNTYVEDILKAVQAGYHFGCYRYEFDSPHKLLFINSWFTRLPFMWCRGGDQSLFIQHTFYRNIGGFDASKPIMEDFDILVRGKKAGGRFKIIPKNVVVSARKYQENLYLRVNFANLVVYNMWKLGYSSTAIKNMYCKLIRHPKE